VTQGMVGTGVMTEIGAGTMQGLGTPGKAVGTDQGGPCL
jgi:hypothetical protein